MKTNQKYGALAFVTAAAVIGMSLSALTFAQAVTPLTCSVAPATVNTNQAAVFSAVGGNGTYSWSGPNLTITNSAGAQFAVSYPNPGVYPISVTSAGQTVSCNMTVVAPTSTGTLACAPAVQNVTLGQTASVSASGGNSTYTWSSPDLTITNANGSGFSANFASAGLKTLTVTSAGLTATCAINVVGSGTATPPVDPGLPNTGGGYNQ